MNEWKTMDSAPKESVFLVWLEEPVMHSNISVMYTHPNINIIGGHFDFDMPKPLRWQPLPEPPTDLQED